MENLTRLYNWQQFLTDLINERMEEPFVWGTNDCALWSADCVKAITGIDFAENVRGTYETPFGAYKAIQKEYGVDNVLQIYQAKFVQQPAVYARQGDVVFQTSNYEGFNAAIGICNGLHSFFLYDPEDGQGLFKVPTLSVDGCFWIG